MFIIHETFFFRNRINHHASPSPANHADPIVTLLVTGCGAFQAKAKPLEDRFAPAVWKVFTVMNLFEHIC